MKRNKNISPILKRIVKHSYLLLLIPAISVNAEDRPGLLLNGAISAEHSDNVLNNLAETSDTAIIVTPDIKYLGLIGKHTVLFSYDGKFANYTKDSDLSYNEHEIAAGARLDHSHKINTEFKLGFDKSIEVPGTANSLTLTDFNKYENKSALAKFYYGQDNSVGQIVLGYRFNDREYINNQQFYRDVEQNQFNATFFYRIAPKTRILFQASTEHYSYDDQQSFSGLLSNQSSDNNTYLTGIEWQATAKSTGTFKIGYQDKDYEDSRFNDISGLSYTLDMIWKPNTYTSFKLGASRETTESAQINEGGFLTTTYLINVSHKLTPLTTLTLQYNVSNDEIVSVNARKDKSTATKLGVAYSLRHWLNIRLAYKYQDKTSNIQIYNFKSNIINLSLETSF